MDLVLWNHFELAQELFYQLALAKFGGGSPVATLGNSPIDIQIIIAQALELEEQLQHCSTHDDANDNDDDASVLKSSSSALLPVSDTNEQLACQAATCLLEHAEMLLEYFSIRIQEVVEERPGDDHDARKKRRTIVISGLPVLLEGHSPPPHGLAVFLLRLATEVDWSEEQPCFQGICRELGAYYAQVPVNMTEPSVKETSNNNSNNNSMNDSLYIQHCLFPAISYLLLPPKRFAKDGSISQLTALPVLYKVFERC
jgi:DNA mismatch repair protein MLH1